MKLGEIYSFFKIKQEGVVLFFCLYPLFFFIQTLVGVGVLPSVLSNQRFILSALFFIPCLYFLKNNFVRSISLRPSNISDVYLFFIVFFVFQVLINFVFGANLDVVVFHISIIMQSLFVFYIFSVLNFRSKALFYSCLLSFAGMSAVVYLFSVNGFFNLKMYGGGDSESIVTYQAFGVAYLMSTLYLLFYSPGFLIRILIYFVAVPVLYLNGARSEFFAFLIGIAIVEFINSKNRIYLSIFVSFLITILLFSLRFLISYLPENRVLNIITLTKDESVSNRDRFFSAGLDSINNSLVLGDYASYNPGEYIHNFVSVWVDLGFVGLVVFLFVTIGLLLSCWKDLLKRIAVDNAALNCSVVLISMAVLLFVTGKYFSYELLPAAAGAYSNFKKKNRLGL